MKHFLLMLSIAMALTVAEAQDLSDLFDKSKNSVVTIYTSENVSAGTGDPRQFVSNMGLGSGVLISEEYILTAAHVVANAEAIMVEFLDGETLPAQTYRVSRIADVALIKLKAKPSDPHVAVLGNSDLMRIGEEVYVIGAPMGLPYSLSRGVISGRHSENKVASDGHLLEFFQTDAAINTGNSGGPMYNMKGEVIGIVSSILTRSGGFEGIGFAATTEICRSLLSSRGSNYFGTEVVPLSYEVARILNVPQESGLLVQHVTRDSPAFHAGLKGGFLKVTIKDQEVLLGGDIILSVDDLKFTSPESIFQLVDYFGSVEGTHTFTLRVLRGGEIREFSWINTDF